MRCLIDVLLLIEKNATGGVAQFRRRPITCIHSLNVVLSLPKKRKEKRKEKK